MADDYDAPDRIVRETLAASAIAGHPIEDPETLDLLHQVAAGELSSDDAVERVKQQLAAAAGRGLDR